MKKFAKYLAAALIVPGCTVGLAACSDYDECPPLNEGYLTTYIMPAGVFLSDAEWTQIEEEEAEYDAFVKSLTATTAAASAFRGDDTDQQTIQTVHPIIH